MKNNKMGGLAYLVGIVLALIVGLVSGLTDWEVPSLLLVVFLVAGLIIGLLNISQKETTPFMVSIILLVVIGIGGVTIQLPTMLGAILDSMGKLLLAVLVPAGVVVGIKTAIGKAN